MQRKLPLRLLDLEFHQCYFVDKGFYSPEHIEEGFKESIIKYQPLISDPSRGPILSLEEWTSTRMPTESFQYVLLQVMQIIPLKIDDKEQNTGLVLHQLEVKPWAYRSDSFMGFFAKGRSHLSRLKSLNLYLVLDRAITHSVLHLYKKGHLALIADLPFMDELAFRSEEIDRRVNDLVELGHTVQIGSTVQQSYQNNTDNYKVSEIRTFVYGDMDFCFVSVGRETTVPGLSNINVVLIDDLDSIFFGHRQDFNNEE